jgi:hypothetical protein
LFKLNLTHTVFLNDEATSEKIIDTPYLKYIVNKSLDLSFNDVLFPLSNLIFITKYKFLTLLEKATI